MESRNRPVENEQLAGTEGAVWYVVEPSGRVSMWKCKPESVEQIHWAVGINKTAVLATCWNLLETQDELNYEALVPLLLEEYDAEEIEGYRTHIDACIAQVNDTLAYQARVLAAYRATGLSLSTHKSEVMRALAQQFPRGEMKRVYSVIARSEK